jgi:hypothetical protein
MRKKMKKILLLLALTSFVFQATSCKSKKAQDDSQIVENADVEKIEAEDAALLSKSESTNNVGPVDESLQAALGETSTQAAADPALTTTEPAATETTVAATPEVTATPTLDEASLNNVPAPDTNMAATPAVESATATPDVATTGAITEMPVAESSTVAQTSTETALTETPVAAPIEASAPVKTASMKTSGAGSLKKITETIPYQHGEGWVNTVYIARPKEKLKEISQKIYGADKTKELKKINTFLAARSPRGGDKIYYVSPNRPADSLKTMSFYEDTGMIAETYVAKKGDNLKKISKNLLGYEDAYKEIWSTNPVASKGALDDGETLRYWKSSTTVTSAVAMNTPVQNGAAAQVIESPNQLPSQPINNQAASTPPPSEMAAPPQPQAELPPPPPMPEAQPVAQNSAPQAAAQPQTELPPPPPPPDMGAAQSPDPAIAATPPPPPAPEDVAAAPVPPKKKVVTPNMEEEQSAGGMSSDTMTMLGGAVVLIALLAFALIRRNKKKKEVEMASMSETNVGT